MYFQLLNDTSAKKGGGHTLEFLHYIQYFQFLNNLEKVTYFSHCAKKETEAQRVKQISQSYAFYLLHTTACATL